MTGNTPIKRISAGQITAALWENEVKINGQPTTVLKVSVQKAYKDKTGTWKTSASFNKTEIPLVQFVLQKAWETMLGERTVSATDSGPVEEEVVA